MEGMNTTTISISEKTRKELLTIVALLQSNRGERVDYDAAIEYLISKSKKSPELLRRAMIGTGLRFEELRKALHEGRGEDKRHEEEPERRHLS